MQTFSITSDQRKALIEAAYDYLRRWPNEKTNPALKNALTKLVRKRNEARKGILFQLFGAVAEEDTPTDHYPTAERAMLVRHALSAAWTAGAVPLDIGGGQYVYGEEKVVRRLQQIFADMQSASSTPPEDPPGKAASISPSAEALDLIARIRGAAADVGGYETVCQQQLEGWADEVANLTAQSAALTKERDEIVGMLDEMMGMPDRPKTLPQRLRDELADYLMVMGIASEVYCHVTGGRISKPNTVASVICSVADDVATEYAEEKVAELTKRAEAAESALAQAQQFENYAEHYAYCPRRRRDNGPFTDKPCSCGLADLKQKATP